MSRNSFGRRINNWLDEPAGEQFTDGKWRFWLVAVLGFGILNSVLTVLIFRETNTVNYLAPVIISASAIVGWIAIGCLHYSDAKRGRMARGVSALDSASLLFVIGHFCLLVYILGHSWILREADRKYAVEIAAYNERAGKVSEDNKAIASAAARIAEMETRRARIENDTAYQQRKAAERGARVRTRIAGSQSAAAGLATSPVELAPPPVAPPDTHAAFLTRWDVWVRLTNFGELILAAATLIFIRNWTAKTNAPQCDEFPEEIEADIEDRRNTPRLAQARKRGNERQSLTVAISGDRKDALKKLREHLKAIAFYHPNRWFKADLIRGGVTIRLFKRDNGHEIMVATTDQSDKLLAAVDRPDFRERLLDELIRQGFPIEKAHDQ